MDIIRSRFTCCYTNVHGALLSPTPHESYGRLYQHKRRVHLLHPTSSSRPADSESINLPLATSFFSLHSEGHSATALPLNLLGKRLTSVPIDLKPSSWRRLLPGNDTVVVATARPR